MFGLFRSIGKPKAVVDTATEQSTMKDRTLEALAALDDERVKEIALDAYWNTLESFISFGDEGTSAPSMLGAN